MKREILFRAWNKIVNRYQEFTLQDIEKNAGKIQWHLLEIEQYAGLTDKNGVKIFEGDLVHYKNSHEWGKGVIEFQRGFVIVWTEQETSNPKIMEPLFYFGCSAEIEVIGNIHTTPSLIEKEQ